MTSNEHALDTLIDLAQAIIRRHGHVALTDHMADHQVEARHLLRLNPVQVRERTNTAPPQVVAALRARPGTQPIVEIWMGRRVLRAVLDPIGYAWPERELAVWHELRDLVLRVA